MTTTNREFVSSLVQILRRADRLAARTEAVVAVAVTPAIERGDEPPRQSVNIAELMAGARKPEDGDRNISRWLGGAKTAIFGMALVLIAIFTFLIGLAGENATHRWVFFAAAGLLAVVGAVQIDRGTGQLSTR